MLLLAHYMPWYEAKPYNKQWGWHWTMNAFDPEQVKNGVRPVASHYYPLIGPYDSGDPAVIEYHLLLMKTAGIDGVMVDWYGLSNLYDYPVIHRNTTILFKRAATLGMRVGVCYEDQTIPNLVAAKRLAAEDRVKHAQQEVQWLRENWFKQPAYLSLNNKPVLLSFGSNGLSDPEWEQVFSGTPNPPVYLSLHRRRPVAAGAFDWPLPQTGLRSLDTFYQSAKNTRVFMPVAFPRFHDIYKEAKVRESYGQIADDQGRTFTKTLERALKSGAPFAQIATWNDWGEGTQIEPSQEFGYRDLETVQRLRRIADLRFAGAPDDLRLPHRLWRLRGGRQNTPQTQAELDKITQSLARGNTSQARTALGRLENASKTDGSQT